MITFLLAMAISAQSVVVVEDPILYEIRESYATITAEIAISDVKFEPVHISTKWPNLGGAHVEPCQSLSNGTQNYTHFKCVDV